MASSVSWESSSAMGPLVRSERQLSGLRQMIAPIEGEAFPTVEPRVVKDTENFFLRDVRLEVGSGLIHQGDLILFLGRTSLVLVGNAPLGDPTGLAAGAALRTAFRQDVFFQ